uniref:A-kinase anchoring protein 5 n=1 Tax=Anolis carolinensis TaxID=28377 RepID=G1KXM8_ANOCA|nr:PREDICTED: A-kinase anchor protein 5 [Anolis carolinensis]|eukprot:XP_008110209.1 PREDICTED: A-kinase anchor protein 5 [Anolis carolinensis]
MEDTEKTVQMESPQKPEALDGPKFAITNQSPAKKASVFCFKKRKKSCEKVAEKEEDGESETLTLKPVSQDSNTGSSGAELSGSLWTSGGAWLAFKRLVTSRRRSKSVLKKQQQSGGSRVQLESQAEDSGVLPCPKERAGLKIPCLRFSRSRKKATNCELSEELDHGEKANEKTSILNDQSNCEEPEVLALEGPLSAQRSSSSEALEETKGDTDIVKNGGNVVNSSTDKVFAVDIGPGPDCYADDVVQSEIIHSEKVLETEEEKQIFQLHQGSLYGDPEEAEDRFNFKVEIGPPIPEILPGAELGVFKTEEVKEAELGKEVDTTTNGSSAKEGNSVEVMLHCSPPAMGEEASDVPVGSDEETKENQPVMPAAGIMIMITEAEEWPDEEEPNQACELFSLAQVNKQKGKKKSKKGADSGGHDHTRDGKPSSKVWPALSGTDQEHWTSEQYEGLLIETAASLVKAAIQSSIEQLVNEMALEQNKQNSFL